MLIDLLIVLAYFITIFIVALSGRMGKDVTTEEYFLSSRNLRWYSVAISTIATNVQGYQFLGMMGSAYLYGLAQGNLEINAIQGLWMSAFIFIPLYLKDKVITVTQFIKNRLGTTASLFYSISNIILFSTIALGGALFWGAYAADLVFGDYLSFIHENRTIRVGILLAGLGIFSATYTYLGGNANLGVWGKTPQSYAFLKEYLTVDRLKELMPEARPYEIIRYDYPNLLGVNFYLLGFLEEGVAASTKMDGQAKSLGEYLRAKVIDVPTMLLS